MKCLCGKVCASQRGVRSHWTRLMAKVNNPCIASDLIYDPHSFLAYLVHQSDIQDQAELDVEALLKQHLQATQGQRTLNLDFVGSAAWCHHLAKDRAQLGRNGSNICGAVADNHKLSLDAYLKAQQEQQRQQQGEQQRDSDSSSSSEEPELLPSRAAEDDEKSEEADGENDEKGEEADGEDDEKSEDE